MLIPIDNDKPIGQPFHIEPVLIHLELRFHSCPFNGQGEILPDLIFDETRLGRPAEAIEAVFIACS
jgi:hypothetical protein